MRAVLTHYNHLYCSLALSVEPFTEREIKTLYLAAMDKTVDETAEIMHLKPNTIRDYRKSILEKTGCRSITGVVGVVYLKLIGSNP